MSEQTENLPAVTFTPKVSFTGYPDGATATHFDAGVESCLVPAEFAELMRGKGYVADQLVAEAALPEVAAIEPPPQVIAEIPHAEPEDHDEIQQ